jgi:hypothetical protein
MAAVVLARNFRRLTVLRREGMGNLVEEEGTGGKMRTILRERNASFQ